MSELFTELPLGKFFETQVKKQQDPIDERVDNLAKGLLILE